ncbi:hypothetical protein [Flavobacterium sp.]|uniref:hypothetical protein n=1 Tax=Flavobacterium sp. TaxID=239 RepID=UPI003753A99B
MKHKNIINYTALSKELTGSKTALKPNNTAVKYIKPLEELNLLIDAWLTWTKGRIK